MAENDWQLHAILDGVAILGVHFEDRPDVYVSGDLLIYYSEGDPRKCVAPDVFVVFGVPRRRRMIYKLWEERKAPDFVLEVASENTWRVDEGPKRTLYADLGVQEHWLLDPREEYFETPLRGLTLVGGRYRPLPAKVEGGRRFFRSQVLGLDLRLEDGRLCFRDPATGEDLRTLRSAEARIAELESRLREVESPR